MKKLLFSMVLVLFCINTFSQTQEEMEAWQKNMTPGKYHEWLSTMNGEWHAKIKMWMDPTQPATESEASTTNEMILNGLYQRSSHSGEMMGMPFMGESITGYDIAKKEFIATWIDNFGSSIMLMKGQLDEATNTLVLEGDMFDPASEQTIKVKEVFKILTEDSHKFEMFMIMDGQEIKNMEILYSKKK
ncbi:hypothetical protein PK35_01175 [Tamlana nanhaiensis]|uniref:DUF1579 domain-containing protein n=1 Tax=Neotamlana nanhaiensis TaxID=1382798 RepID=A0A0D7W5Z1_9FLAO|nr:DUF1579 domain-containing protein [Tamlana nanhaiensis]KJD34439.1 hypothetical protein PK35_01175 [Tamlana nanhaiensis]